MLASRLTRGSCAACTRRARCNACRVEGDAWPQEDMAAGAEQASLAVPRTVVLALSLRRFSREKTALHALVAQHGLPLQELLARMAAVCLRNGALMCQRWGATLLFMPDPAAHHAAAATAVMRTTAAQLLQLLAKVRPSRSIGAARQRQSRRHSSSATTARSTPQAVPDRRRHASPVPPRVLLCARCGCLLSTARRRSCSSRRAASSE